MAQSVLVPPTSTLMRYMVMSMSDFGFEACCGRSAC
jgi:hypothetical protein